MLGDNELARRTGLLSGAAVWAYVTAVGVLNIRDIMFAQFYLEIHS